MKNNGTKIIKSILFLKRDNHKKLTNYACEISQHNFYDIFPKNEFNFSNTSFEKYFYLGKEETAAILQDYFLLLKNAYNTNTFTYEHFYSVVKEFIEYLESEKVFFNFKTYYGHKILNNNVAGFVTECHKLLNIVLTGVNNPKYNEFEFPREMVLKGKYNFVFFDFLTRKIKNTLYSENFVFEPILLEDCEKIQRVYLNDETIENAPFYLNKCSKYYKYIRPRIADYVLSMLPKERAWVLVTTEGKEVAIFILSPGEKNEVVLNIVADCDYMDSKLAEALEVVKDYAFTVMQASKLIGKNNNESIAYSNVVTAYSLAKFEANYDTAVGDNGLTRMEYTYKLVEDDINTLKTPDAITPISFSTFSVYKSK